MDSEEVGVSVKDGIAILFGTVDSWAERLDAIENAYEGGARSVRDELKVPNGPAENRP